MERKCTKAFRQRANQAAAYESAGGRIQYSKKLPGFITGIALGRIQQR